MFRQHLQHARFDLFMAIALFLSLFTTLSLLGCNRTQQIDHFRELVRSSERYQDLQLEGIKYTVGSRIAGVFQKGRHYRYSLTGEVECPVDLRLLFEVIYRMGLENTVHLNVSTRETGLPYRTRNEYYGVDVSLDSLLDFMGRNARYEKLAIAAIEFPQNANLRTRFSSGVEPLREYLLMGSVASGEDLGALVGAIHVADLQDRIVLEIDVMQNERIKEATDAPNVDTYRDGQ